MLLHKLSMTNSRNKIFRNQISIKQLSQQQYYLQQIPYFLFITFQVFFPIAQPENEIKSIFPILKTEFPGKSINDLCLNYKFYTFIKGLYPNVINTTLFRQKHIIIQKQINQRSNKPMFSTFPHFYTQRPVLYYFLSPNLIFPWPFKNAQELISLQGQKQTRNSIDVKKQQANIKSCLEKSCQFSSVVDEKSRKYNEAKNQFADQDYLLQLKDVKSRNILPNAINLILSFIRRINKSGKIAQKIIDKLGEGCYDIKKYYSYQAYLKDVITSYTSKNILHLVIDFCNPSCKIFTLDQQKFYSMVTRNLVLHFIKVEGPLALFTSKKEHKTRKIDHLKVYRYIIRDLQHLYRKKEKFLERFSPLQTHVYSKKMYMYTIKKIIKQIGKRAPNCANQYQTHLWF